MAINFGVTYPDRCNPPSPEYPFGSARNVNGLELGTPVDEAWINDIFGFMQALASSIGVVPNGVPDTALNSQYAEALTTFYENIRDAVEQKAAETENIYDEITPIYQDILDRYDIIVSGGISYASENDAVEGIRNDVAMTPLRTRQVLDERLGQIEGLLDSINGEII